MQDNVRHKQLRLKTQVMILIMILAGPLGNTMLGKGMKSIGAVSFSSGSVVLETLGRILSSGTIWLGIALMITLLCCLFPGAVVGGLQLCAAGIGHGLRSGSRAGRGCAA